MVIYDSGLFLLTFLVRLSLSLLVTVPNLMIYVAYLVIYDEKLVYLVIYDVCLVIYDVYVVCLVKYDVYLVTYEVYVVYLVIHGSR